MNWDTFFDVGENVTAEEARQFMASSKPELYQLVDVRQPKEYEKSHIPGTILIPMADLPARHPELNKDIPIIVYCQSGIRSKAACQILLQAGTKYVFNMIGGIITWQGEESTGDETAGLEYFAAGNFATTFALAFQMEAGLKQFYLTLAGQTANEEEKRMLTQMAKLEDGHMAKLVSRHRDSTSEISGEGELHILEGVLDINEMVTVFGNHLGTPEKALQLGMKFEAQAFDLYCRLALKHDGTEAASFYREMALEEQQHLARLGRELDTLLERN